MDTGSLDTEINAFVVTPLGNILHSDCRQAMCWIYKKVHILRKYSKDAQMGQKITKTKNQHLR